MKARSMSMLVAGAFAIFVVVRAGMLAWTGRNLPRVQVDNALADLGRIPTSQPVQHHFALTNVGRAELLVVDTKANCECALRRITQRALAPGESAALDLTYTPKKPGKRQQRIVVTTNDPINPVAILTITADVYDAATIASPPDLGVTP